MSKVFPPYDDDLTVADNIKLLIFTELTSTLSPGLQAQRNPFIYMMSLKNLMLMGKLGLTMSLRSERETTPVTLLLAYKELDLMLAEDSSFNSKRVSPIEFIKHLMDELMPRTPFALYLKSDS